MADITAQIANLNPFSKHSRKGNEDVGDTIEPGAVGNHFHILDSAKATLPVSHALKAFIAKNEILPERDVGLGAEHHTEALRSLLCKPHIHVPPIVTDRSYPLPDYFISSSHNTYLLAHQLFGESNASGYRTALTTGSRCVEIDAWDNPDNVQEPKVTHGYTLVSHIPFRAVCETIRDVYDEELEATFKTPGQEPSPILISLENHCGPEGQLRLVQIMNEVWGDRLLSKAIREGADPEHVTLKELRASIAVIVEFHFPDEVEHDDDDDEEEEEEDGVEITEEERKARQEYKQKKKTQPSTLIVPELAALGVYAQSVKPVNNSWFDSGELLNGPHHHLINVSESGLKTHLPANKVPISIHNSRHLMRVFPKGTRITSSNLKPVPFWGLGAQVCALNWQTYGTSNQLNDALFFGTDGFVLKPEALRAGGSGNIATGRKKRLRLHVAGASNVPLQDDNDGDNAIKPYLTCNLYHPDDLENEPPKRKTSAYRQHKLGFLHRGENPPPTDPIWDETLEWEYDDNELVFLRLLIKSDDSWAVNPIVAALAVRLSYVTPGWSFLRMMDLKGKESDCSVLVKFEFEDIE
ncbi:unnamed protein product [Clonostachys rhizophaga]|uniref:Phosphoinositide phospholipase C n=1 Tax=Clonostachys rhizophaga TaxID=160324 RepID=A0A9N9YUT2_9HYPO|nr:unnamed protein product [Clonostachys rhizophaga]